MKVDCSLDINKDTKYCVCLNAVKTFNNAVEDYNKRYQIYDDDKSSYSRYKKDLSDWGKKQKGTFNDYTRFQKIDYPTEFWANDTDGTCWPLGTIMWDNTKWNEAHNWCHWAGTNKKNVDGENYWASDRRRCGFWGAGDFKCSRDSNVIRAEKEEYARVKPTTDPNNGKFWENIAEPTPPTFNAKTTIVCCNQSFDNLEAKSINFENVVQNCNADTNDTTTNTENSNTNTENSNTNTENSNTNEVNNQSNLFIILFIVLIIILFILILLFS